MPGEGQILYHKNFVYLDRKTGEKLCVVLNTCSNEDTCLVLKTTSQSSRYFTAMPGCHPSQGMFCVYKECGQDFPEETFIQLDYVYPIVVETLLRTNQVSFVGHMSEVCFKNLKKCLRNFRADIPQKYWSIIYSSK